MFSANSPCKRDRLDDPKEESEPPVKKQTDFDDEDFGDNDDNLDLIQGKASDQPTISKDEPSAPAGDGEYPPSKVLLFTVQNHNNFPVDVSVLHNICTAKGQTVNRIVMIRRNGVQAMVEFDNVETAAAIKGSLNGEFIYSGCCNLKIDWGKPQSLNVIKNVEDNWDYTLPDSNKDTAKKSQPLLPLPHGYALRSGLKPFPSEGYPGQAAVCDPYARLTPDNPMTCGPRSQGNMHGALNSGPGILSNQHLLCRGPTPGAQTQKLPPTSASGSDDGNSMLQQGSVLMVYGMNKDEMNCQRVVNLFCPYGDVVGVVDAEGDEPDGADGEFPAPVPLPAQPINPNGGENLPAEDPPVDGSNESADDGDDDPNKKRNEPDHVKMLNMYLDEVIEIEKLLEEMPPFSRVLKTRNVQPILFYGSRGVGPHVQGFLNDVMETEESLNIFISPGKHNTIEPFGPNLIRAKSNMPSILAVIGIDESTDETLDLIEDHLTEARDLGLPITFLATAVRSSDVRENVRNWLYRCNVPIPCTGVDDGRDDFSDDPDNNPDPDPSGNPDPDDDDNDDH